MAGIENFKIYQMACELEKRVYEITTNFPADEKYRQVDQLRRSSASVCDNVSEGYGKFSYQSKIQSYYIARGEAEEARSQTQRATNKGFVDPVTGKEIVEKYTELIKAINGYVRYLKNKKEANTSS